MSNKVFRRLLATATLALLGQFAIAPAARAQVITVRPQARILQPIDGKVTSSFTNSTPSALAKAADLGPAAANTPMHVALALKSSDAQEHALRTLLDQQHDSGTTNFHKWITPDQFGASFGVDDADIQKITGWLQSQGFSVDAVAKGHRLITFSGNAGQVASAFHTSMHSYKVAGETHISNSTDIAVPSAIKDVIASAPNLNDFESTPMHTPYHSVTRNNDGTYVESLDGNFTSQTNGSHFMSPGDFAKIYNTTASGMDGTGVTIGIVGRTNILLADVQAYRRLFGLPDNDPVIAPVGVLPGHSTGDEVESDLDVEWSGGVAPKAKIIFAPAANVFNHFDGVTISALALVEANQVDIISISYGSCEARNGPGYWDLLWEQAAAQGQSVFVSSGDSGAAGCDSAGNPVEQFGFGVNVIASSNFNTAVGGTEFNEGTGTFWAPTNNPTNVSALSYIPETTWNESSSVTENPNSGLFASGGGVSTFFGRPAWQVGSGIPAVDPIDVSGQGLKVSGPHRLVPDVALAAAGGHDGALICYEGACSINADGTLRNAGVVGGTSLAAPSFAGLQALINQKMGGRQGLANYQYYALAAQQFTGALSCNAAGATLPDAKCVFNDTTTGNNGELNLVTGLITTSFNAGPGYDLVTGLGSVNATNLINNFGSLVFNSTTTTLTLAKTTFTRDQDVAFTISVSPGSQKGTPTGDVTFVTTLTNGNPVPAFFTLAGGTVTGTLSGLPGGTYQVVARYGGDGVFGSSISAPVTVTVGPEASTTTSDLFSLVAGVKTTYNGGDAIAIDAFVNTSSNSNNNGVPTGTVSFIDNGTTVATLPLNAYGTVQLISGHNFTNFPTNAPPFAIGNHSVVAQFNGNPGMTASSAAPITFTVTKGATTVNLTSSSASIAPGASVAFNVSIPNIGSVPATGIVTFLDGTTALGTQTLTNGAAAFATTAITTAGVHPITASYAGDANYNTGVSPVTNVTVGNNQPTTITVTAANAAPFVNQSNTYTATITFSGGFPFGFPGLPGFPIIFFPTGTVRFYDGANLLGTANVSGPSASISFAGLPVGAHNITAVYSGDSSFASSTSAATVVTPVPNVTGVREINPAASTYGHQVSFQARVFANPSLIPILPSQPVQFFDGTTLLGTAPLVYYGDSGFYLATLNSNALGGGTHSITAVYNGDPNYTTATGLAPLSIVVAPAVSTTTLTVAPVTAIQLQTITLTANVVVSGPAPATGTVQFFDGTTLLGTSPVNAAGVATLTTSFLAVGPHSITATYSGDANYTGSSSTASAATTEAITQAFTVNAIPSTLIIKRGENGFAAITVTSAAGFSGTITLGCTGLPTNATCAFSQPTVSGSQTVELIIKGHADASTLASMTRTDGDMPSPIPALAFWLPGVALSGFGLGRKRSARQRQMLLLAIFALGLGGMMGLAGCGAGNGVSAAPGTYNVTVTGTSGTIVNSAPLTITIK